MGWWSCCQRWGWDNSRRCHCCLTTWGGGRVVNGGGWDDGRGGRVIDGGGWDDGRCCRRRLTTLGGGGRVGHQCWGVGVVIVVVG